jgi:hypothetical protein
MVDCAVGGRRLWGIAPEASTAIGGPKRNLDRHREAAVKKRLTICLTDRLIDHGLKSNKFRNSALHAHFR